MKSFGTDCLCRIIIVLLLILVVVLVMIILGRNGPSLAALGGAAGGVAGSGGTSGGDCPEEGGDDDSDSGSDSDSDSDSEAAVDGGRKGKDLAVREPWFEKVAAGKITVIGRINRGPFKEIKEGDEVTIRRSRAPDDKTEYPGERRFHAKITSRTDYPTAEAMIEKEGLAKMYSGVKSIDKAVEEFRGSFHTTSDEKEHGVVAFGIKREKGKTHE